MTEKTIAELEAKIRAESIGDERKRELLQLLAKLKMEIATSEKQNLQPLKNSVEELRSSVEGFEKSHPRLVQIVNSISNTLSNLGI
ncbi:MAG TPA: DUF4404 family protein [Methylomirabilota bacterium]|nr:DUF4404 family protein [Methylomirabilota bacterium]